MKVVTAVVAAAMVESGWTVACAGFVGAGHAEAVTSALEQRFLATGQPRDLTLVYSAGQGDRKTRGVNHFGNRGMTRVVCGGHWRSATRLQRMALAEEIEAYSLPQGVVTHLYRAIAGGQPGVLTRVGLHTFVDPRTSLDARYQGGALNRTAERALASGRKAWVQAVQSVPAVDGGAEDFLFYPSFPIHCAFIRATSADPRGNLSTHDEAFRHELLALAQAAHNSGGIVIAQVRSLVPRHESLSTVHVPGIVVDYVVVSEDPLHHQMTFGEDHNPTYLLPWRGEGTTGAPVAAEESAALEARVYAQRRAVLEIQRRAPRVVNLGVGMPALVGGMAHAAGLEGFTLTVEAGPSGGTPADGFSFGASAYPESVVDQPAQFDFYDGGGIDLAILGMAELDACGDVNVSRFGEGERAIIAGVGGFINITQGARAVVFVGTLTAGGLRVAVDQGELRILAEGHSRKVVEAVSHLSFNASFVAQKRAAGTPVLYITERAVFETQLGADGRRRLTLIEIAPGLDLQRDVLDQCQTQIAVSPELRTMDPRIFAPGPFRLAPALTSA